MVNNVYSYSNMIIKKNSIGKNIYKNVAKKGSLIDSFSIRHEHFSINYICFTYQNTDYLDDIYKESASRAFSRLCIYKDKCDSQLNIHTL